MEMIYLISKVYPYRVEIKVGIFLARRILHQGYYMSSVLLTAHVFT